MMLCAPGDLGGADNPSGLSLTKLTLQIVFAMSNYRGGTPLQAPTKWLNPRTYVAIKPRVGAHWYPARGKNKVERNPNLVEVPFPVSFPVFCAVQSTAPSSAVCGGGVCSCCDLRGAGLLPNTEFSMGWTSPLFSSGVMRYQGAALTLEKPQGLSWLGVKLFEYFKMKIRYGDLKKTLLETCHLLKCILGNGCVQDGAKIDRKRVVKVPPLDCLQNTQAPLSIFQYTNNIDN